MSIEIINGNLTKKSDAHHLFHLDPSKIDRVYDMLVKKGIAQPWNHVSPCVVFYCNSELL